jgi:hypothetical protein
VLRRRILVYELPPNSSKNNQKHLSEQEMILRYSSDKGGLRSSSRALGNDSLDLTIDLKRGQYKVFIECGKAYLQDYFSQRGSYNKN